MPQAPQLALLVSGLVQPVPGQNTCPVMPQMHMPLRHSCPVGHALLQRPQWSALVLKSTHAPAAAQYAWPAVGQRQVPAVHVSVGLQARPQVPQFWASVASVRHAPEQFV